MGLADLLPSCAAGHSGGAVGQCYYEAFVRKAVLAPFGAPAGTKTAVDIDRTCVRPAFTTNLPSAETNLFI